MKGKGLQLPLLCMGRARALQPRLSFLSPMRTVYPSPHIPPLLLSLAALAMLSQSAYDAWRQKEKRYEGHRHKGFLHTSHDKCRWQCISIHSYSPSSTMTELELSGKPMWYRIKRYPDTGVSVYPVLHNLYCKCNRTFLL